MKRIDIKNNEPLTFGLAIWRGDKYILSFLFAISSGTGLDFFQIPPHRQAVPLSGWEDKGEVAVRRKFYAVHAFDCAIGR